MTFSQNASKTKWLIESDIYRKNASITEWLKSSRQKWLRDKMPLRLNDLETKWHRDKMTDRLNDWESKWLVDKMTCSPWDWPTKWLTKCSVKQNALPTKCSVKQNDGVTMWLLFKLTISQSVWLDWAKFRYLASIYWDLFSFYNRFVVLFNIQKWCDVAILPFQFEFWYFWLQF